MACRYVFLESAKEELEEEAAYLLKETGSKRIAGDFLESIQRAIEITCNFSTMHAVSRMPELAELGYCVMLAGSIMAFQRLDVVHVGDMRIVLEQ